MQTTARSILILIAFLVACFAAAGIGSLFTFQSVRTWYPDLAKPSGTPPPWVFGPVWTTLYILMAVAAWRVWSTAGGWSAARTALTIFFAQLILNALWSAIFFGARSPGTAFAEIVLLWMVILATTVAFWKISALAGALMLPYLIWVSYAARLNFWIWRLNRG